MKNKNTGIVLVLCICTFFSCKSKEEQGFEKIQELVANSILNKFKGSMSYKLNGVLITVAEPTAIISPNDGKQYFSGETGSHLLNITFPKILQEGETSTTCTANYMLKEPQAIYTDGLSSTVTISKKNDKEVVGTFSFEINESKGIKNVVHITEGKFKVEVVNPNLPF